MLGIDVHGDKGAIDWKLVRKAGYQFAFVKASEGATFIDARIGANLKDAKAAGILVGPYHYARPDNRPSVSGAVQEADHFCNVIESIYDPTVHGMPVLDIEVGSGRLSDWAAAFCQRVEARTGVTPIIYSYTYFIRSHLTDPRLSRYMLWLANYGTNNGQRQSIPAGEGPWEKWSIHQFTSNGRVQGVQGGTGRVDLNFTLLKLDDLRGKVVREPVDVDPDRPEKAPKRIPRWVWQWLKWRKNRHKKSVGGGGGKVGSQ